MRHAFRRVKLTHLACCSDVTAVRVVDASEFPSLHPGHPQSVVYMLAGRAADFLKLARGAAITTTLRALLQETPGYLTRDLISTHKYLAYAIELV